MTTPLAPDAPTLLECWRSCATTSGKMGEGLDGAAAISAPSLSPAEDPQGPASLPRAADPRGCEACGRSDCWCRRCGAPCSMPCDCLDRRDDGGEP
jgi:hypothetical protein